jgi:purine-binding chemotaxis protein CheW
MTDDDIARRPAAASAGGAGPAGNRTLLTFRLQGEIFALGVEQVSEVIDPLPMTRVPRAGPLVPGLVNVRGSVVPVMSLRHRLGAPEAEATADTRMIVLRVALEGEQVTLAVTADSVERVLEIGAAEIESVPEIGIGWPPDCLAGVAKREGDLVILLDPAAVFSPVRDRADAA